MVFTGGVTTGGVTTGGATTGGVTTGGVTGTYGVLIGVLVALPELVNIYWLIESQLY